MLTKTKKANAVKKTQKHEKDTGSSEVQVSLLSKKIEELSEHLKRNHKDNHSRRGLLGMVAKRQSHLKYLEKKQPKAHAKVVKELGLKQKKSS